MSIKIFCDICKVEIFTGMSSLLKETTTVSEVEHEKCSDCLLAKFNEPEEEKSFGQVAHDAYWDKGGSEFSELSIYMVNLWEKVSQAVLDEAKRRGMMK